MASRRALAAWVSMILEGACPRRTARPDGQESTSMEAPQLQGGSSCCGGRALQIHVQVLPASAIRATAHLPGQPRLLSMGAAPELHGASCKGGGTQNRRSRCAADLMGRINGAACWVALMQLASCMGHPADDATGVRMYIPNIRRARGLPLPAFPARDGKHTCADGDAVRRVSCAGDTGSNPTAPARAVAVTVPFLEVFLPFDAGAQPL